MGVRSGGRNAETVPGRGRSSWGRPAHLRATSAPCASLAFVDLIIEDEHTRQLPRLTAGPFRYTAWAEDGAVKAVTRLRREEEPLGIMPVGKR